MPSDKVLLLGYPIQTVKITLEDSILQLIKGYWQDHRPRFATTLNALIIGQLSELNPHHLTHKEVVNCLKHADIIGLDSAFLKKVGALLNEPDLELITPEILFQTAIEVVTKNQLSLFLVGGNEATLKATLIELKKDYPNLKIVGSVSPSIFTKGERIEESLERDELILDTINIAKPDLVFLQLGHPKEEIWFERVKDSLKVPLCIGVGGAFDRYLDKKGIQSYPKDSWNWKKIKRRVHSFMHYAIWLPPLIFYHWLNKALTDLFHFKKEKEDPRHLFISEKETLTVLPFPELQTNSLQDQILNWVDESFEHDNILIDFSSVKHINPRGLGLLYTIWKKSFLRKKNLYFLGISPDLRWLIKLHGAWDFVAPYACNNPDDVLERMSTNRGLALDHDREFISIQQSNRNTVISFFGTLHGLNAPPYSLKQIEQILQDRPCILNLKYCSHIDNKGFGFILKLNSFQEKQNQEFIIENCSRELKKQFKKVNLKHYFNFR